MATISAGDLVKLRNGQHQVTPYLSILKPATLLSARVNNATIPRGEGLIDYDTGSGALFALAGPGQTLWVGSAAGKRDKGRVRIKLIVGTVTSGQILVDENGISWSDNDYLTILYDYEIWPIPPRIAGGVFYKFFNLPYSDENLLPLPVAIAGSHQAEMFTGSPVVFSLSGSSSYAIAQGASIASYLWESPGGGVIAAPTSADTTITISTAGAYWVSLTVTDSNGKTQTTRRLIYADDNPYFYFSIDSLSGDWSNNGWQASITAFGDVTLDDFPDGALCVLWNVGKIDGVEDYVNLWGIGNNILMSGYIQRDQDNDNLTLGTGQVSFELVGPQAVLDNMTESGTIVLNAVPAPTAWYEYASWLTVGRSIHHELKWHSTVLDVVDVYGLTNNVLGVKNQDFTEPTILQRCNGRAADINAKLVSDRVGRLHLVQDSQMLNTAGRTALDTVFTLTDLDAGGGINVPRQQTKRVAVSTLDGFSFDGNTGAAIISIIPAYRPSSETFGVPEFQGTGAAKLPSQVLSGQTDANERVGRLHARENNPIPEIRITAPANYLGAFDIVPSIGWYAWGISNATLKRELELNGINTVCRRVDLSHNNKSGVLNTSVVLEAEALGPDGLVGNYPTSYPPPGDYGTEPVDPEYDCEFVVQAPVEFEAGDTSDQKQVVIISETQAIVAYRDEGDSFRLKAICLDWSTGVIVPGTEITFESTSGGSIDGVSLIPTAASIIVSYGISPNTYAIVIERTTGTTLVAGTRLTLAGALPDPGPIVALTATKAILFSAITVGFDVNAGATPITISGTTLTQGTETISSIPVGGTIDVRWVSDTIALGIYNTPTPDFFTGAVLISLASDVAEIGEPIVLTSVATGNSRNTAPQIAILTETLALVAVCKNLTDEIFLYLLGIENLALSVIDSNEELTTDGEVLGIIPLDFDLAQLLYRDATAAGFYQTVTILGGVLIQVNDDATQFAAGVGLYNSLDALDAVTTIGIFGTSNGQAVLTTCE